MPPTPASNDFADTGSTEESQAQNSLSHSTGKTAR